MLIAIGFFGAVGVAAFFLTDVSGSTQVALTLSPPTLEDGLVGHWTFDGKNMPNGQVNDRSGNGNHGSMLNMPTTTAYVTGTIGQALFFGGSDTRINIGDTPSLDITGDKITLAGWVYDDGTANTNGYVMGKVVGSWNYALFVSHGNQTVNARFNLDGVGGTLEQCGRPGGVGGLDFMHNRWNHVAGVYDGGYARVYINGVQSGTTCDLTAFVPGTLTPNNDGFAIGDRGTANDTPFKGKIDDVRLYSRALSADEIKLLYQLGATTKVATTPASPTSGTGPSLGTGLVAHWTFDGNDTQTGQVNDISGQGYHGSQVGMATATAITRGVIGQALKFDGSNDEIRIAGGPVLSTNATMAGWLYWESGLGALIRDNTAGAGWILVADNAGNILARVGGTSIVTTNSVSLYKNAWHHYAVTKEGVRAVFYIDGQEINSINNAADTGSELPWRIMRNGINAQYINGKADDVRIYNRALSSDEVKALYDIGATTKVGVAPTAPRLDGASSGLIGHWTFDGKNLLQNAADSSGQGNTGYLTGFISTTTARGVIGQALKFDGTNDWVNLPGLTNDFDVNKGTFALWMKRTFLDTVSENKFALNCATNDSNYTTFFYNNFSDDWWARYTAGGINDEVIVSPGSVPINEWTYILWTWDTAADQLKFYINGVQVGTTQSTLGTWAGAVANCKIAQHVTQSEREFQGLIDDVRAYNRPLSADEVTQLYQMGR